MTTIEELRERAERWQAGNYQGPHTPTAHLIFDLLAALEAAHARAEEDVTQTDVRGLERERDALLDVVRRLVRLPLPVHASVCGIRYGADCNCSAARMFDALVSARSDTRALLTKMEEKP